jgi:hypothetical protein
LAKGLVNATVIAGDVAKAMKLTQKLPLICGAIGALKFQNQYRVKQLSRKGPGGKPHAVRSRIC